MRAGFSFSYPPISLLLGQPLSIKKSYAGAIHGGMYYYRIYFKKISPVGQSAVVFPKICGILVENSFTSSILYTGWFFTTVIAKILNICLILCIIRPSGLNVVGTTVIRRGRLCRRAN
jgi:hypothetical protein